MHYDGRAAGGGVGALLVAIGLIVVALSAGWLSGTVADRLRPHGCVGPCSPAVAAAEPAPEPTKTAGPTPTPEPADPDGFPYVSAKSIAVIDSACGALIYGRDEHAKEPPASLTKLMTAAVAVDRADIRMMITTKVDGAKLHDDTGSTVMGLEPGMRLSLLDLLYGLLLPSGNDAAIAIAEGISGSQNDFVALMNEKAGSLALRDTHFANPHGLFDEEHYSSAYDMGMLARYVMQNEELRKIVAAISWQPRWDAPPVWNGNRLLTDYPGADGVKIGYTEESQQTIVGSATRDGRRLITSLMRSQDRYSDAQRLLDWAFAQPSPCP